MGGLFFLGGLAARHGDPFVAAVTFVIDVLEGGGLLVSHPRDRGKTTRWGISQKANPDLDVANLSREQAVSVYHERYWLPCRADRLRGGLALQVFAAYVNMAPGSAVRCLQHALCRAGRGVTVDGVIGPETIGAARNYLNQSELRARMSVECIQHHLADVRNHPPQIAFLEGWLWRVSRVADEAGKWGDE